MRVGSTLTRFIAEQSTRRASSITVWRARLWPPLRTEKEEFVLAGKDNRGGNVVDIGGADDGQRAAVNREVDHAADLIVVEVIRGDQASAQPCAQSVQVVTLERTGTSGCGHGCDSHQVAPFGYLPLGPEQGTWLAWVDAEYDNLRLALEWLRDHGGSEEYLRLGGALSVFWEIRGHLTEGRRWLDGELARKDEAPAPMTAKALRGAGMIAREQGDYAAAVALAEEALTLFRDLGDTLGIARTAHLLGVTASDVGDYAYAATMLAVGLALFQALGDAGSVANMLNDLGVVARRRQDFALAERLFEESLATARVAGNDLGWPAR